MKTKVLMAVGVWIALASSISFAALKEGVRLEADGKIIDTQTGHLVPCAMDWNNDGNKDLVVGQFSGGKIGLYLNTGTDARPVLKHSGFLQAGGAEIRLPAG